MSHLSLAQRADSTTARDEHFIQTIRAILSGGARISMIEKVISYEEWNSRLLDHYFRGDGEIVDELDVTEHELAEIGRVENGVRSLMDAVRKKIHEPGDLQRRWSYNAQISCEPEYFAFLVATCRIEWKRESGQFASAFERALSLNSSMDWIELLPKLWTGLAGFLEKKQDEDSSWRQIALPDHYQHFTRIGYSVGLVFPRRSDRRTLEEMFRDYMDREPPLADVVSSLRRVMPQLSSECREEADWYCANAQHTASDDRVRRFTRVLRRSLFNALYQVDLDLGDATCAHLCFWVDEDGFGDPWLVLKDGAEVPARFDVLPDAGGIPDWSRVIQPSSSNGLAPSGLGILKQPDDDAHVLVPTELRNALRSGMIPLVTVESVDGNECLVPAVRPYESERVVASLVNPSHHDFDATQMRSQTKIRIEGVDWIIVEGLFAGKSDINGQRLRVNDCKIGVTGLRIRGTSLVATERFRPTVRCDLAAEIRAHARSGEQIMLSRVAEGDWQIPPGVRGEVILIAVANDGSQLSRRRIDLTDRIPVTVSSKWPVPNSGYWTPSPCPALGSRAKVCTPGWFPLQCDNASSNFPSTDVWESSEIWLGPRVGDVSARPEPGFEWRLAESDDQQQRILLYSGDINNPTGPNVEATSSHKGACRLWRRAFDPSQTKCLDENWQETFLAYSRLRNPETHRLILGRLPSKYSGTAPPRVVLVEANQSGSVSDQVSELELILSARASARATPLPWRQIQTDFEDVVGDHASLSGLHLSDVIRAWQETGVFDAVGMPWHGVVIIPRKPHFLVRSRGKKLVSVLVGLANASLRSAILNSLQDGWIVKEKHSISPLVPPVLEAVCSDGDATRALGKLNEISRELGLSDVAVVPWPDTSELPDSILALKDFARFYDKTASDLPATAPVWCIPIGDFGVKVGKVRARGQAPVWIVGPYKDRYALCTSADWAWRLAMLTVGGNVGFTYGDGVFRRDVRLQEAHGMKSRFYLPLEVGRLLTVLSRSLPGPTNVGYEYTAPTDLTGTIIARQLDILES